MGAVGGRVLLDGDLRLPRRVRLLRVACLTEERHRAFVPALRLVRARARARARVRVRVRVRVAALRLVPLRGELLP